MKIYPSLLQYAGLGPGFLVKNQVHCFTTLAAKTFVINFYLLSNAIVTAVIALSGLFGCYAHIDCKLISGLLEFSDRSHIKN